MDEKMFQLSIPGWYQELGPYTFETKFLKLRPEAVAALAQGAGGGEKISMDSEISRQVIAELKLLMRTVPGNSFVSVDCCAPTDTERFMQKGGAVYSAKSAWFYLVQSEKVASAAAAGMVEHICVRPFRRVSKAREFRLFIRDGKLVAMSQYHLIRHFRRLEGVKERYWNYAVEFINKISWQLPVKDLVMDIYITASNRIMIFDLNCWGEPTSPLLLNSWERDWDEASGIHLILPPTPISGTVKVSF